MRVHRLCTCIHISCTRLDFFHASPHLPIISRLLRSKVLPSFHDLCQPFRICKSIFSHWRWHLWCVNNSFYFTEDKCEYSVLCCFTSTWLFMLRGDVWSAVWTLWLRTPSKASPWLQLEVCWCKLCFWLSVYMHKVWIQSDKRSKQTQKLHDFQHCEPPTEVTVKLWLLWTVSLPSFITLFLVINGFHFDFDLH